jgi:drug/metabolite transporter (DMT)-like permease
MTQTSSATAGLAFAVGSATLYGLNIGYARLASFDGIGGSAIVVYRVLLMLVLVAAFAFVLRRPIAIARGEGPVMGVLGIATTLVGVSYLSSVTFIPVTVAVVLFYTFPTFIVIASPFVEGTRLTPSLAGIATLALLGVVLVVGPAVGSIDWRGIALALLASVAAVMQFFAAARCRATGVVAKVFWIHLLVLPASALIGAATGSLEPPAALALAPYAVGMTIAGYIFGFVLQLIALGRISAVVAGIVYCLEPVVAAVTSTFLLGETLTGLQLFGGALVLAAIIANVIVLQRRPSAPPLVPVAEAASSPRP